MNSRRIKLCLEFMQGNLLRYVGAVVGVIVSVMIGFITPLLFSEIIDAILTKTRPLKLPSFLLSWVDARGGVDFLVSNLWIAALALITLNVINGLFQYFKGRWSAEASENIAETIRNRLYSHIQHLSYNYHVKAETGDLIQRCTSDVDTIRRFLSGQLIEMFRAVFMVVIAISIMIPMSPKMTAVSMIIVPIIFVFAWKFFSIVIKNFKLCDEAEGKMSAVLQENLTGMRVVKAFGRAKFEVDKFDVANKDYKKKVDKLLLWLAIYWSSSDFMSMMQTGTTLVFGIFMAIAGEITVGQLIVFTSYVGMLLWPIRNLGRMLSDMGKTMVSLERIDEVLRQKAEEDAPDAVKAPIDKDIEFDNVSFEYDDNHKVLDGVSFKVKQGQTVAILGATGTGKSTLVHLLQRLYDVKGGAIRIGGVNVNDIQKNWLRSRIGLVLQEPFLYSRSVKDNIGIAVSGITDEKTFTSAEIAHAHSFITEFEKGYDTIVGERGVTLSGGQKQRVAIARTLCKDNDILIFDDSLSAVDTETDASIRHALKENKRGITTFIISHRITTLAEADLILVLDKGRIIQRGTHNELIREEGLYKRINQIQNELEEELSRDAS